MARSMTIPGDSVVHRALILVRLRRTVRRRTPNMLRGTGILCGVLLTVGALAVGAGLVVDAASTPLALMLVFLAWGAGWLLGPVQTGGDGFLRPEWFTMLPGSRTKLAISILVASSTGYGAVFTLGVASSLVVYAARHGVLPLLMSIPAALVLSLGFVLASKVVGELLGNAVRTRLAIEVAAFNYGLLVAACLVGWVAIWGVLERMSGTRQDLTSVIPEWAVTTLYLSPTSWGIAGVDALAAGRWLLALAATVGLVLLVAGGFVLWNALLARRLEGRTHRDRRTRRSHPRLLVSSSGLGAVVRRDLRSWRRDPRRAVEVRSTLWASAFSILAVWLLVPDVLPFAGVLVAVLGTIGATNIYAMDGTALWVTLMAPHGERSDVRGRQLSWLLVFGTAAIVASVLAVALSGAWWAVPAILALLPAALGGAAGLVPLIGVSLLVPETDAHKRTGNPAETGAGAETFGLYWAMTIACTLAVAPPSATLAWVLASDRLDLSWLAILVGVVTGVTVAWSGGALAVRRLEQHGPELLQKMRIGPRRRATTSP